MLDRLRQIAIFAKTVDHGSFRAAAGALGLSPSVVSHHVAELERYLGAPLLYRSTRKLSLTSDGERLLASARQMIDAAEDGLQAVSDVAAEPSGELRVTAPAALAQSALADCLAAFSVAHPNVSLTLDFSDLRREVIGDGMDVAIRMGWLKDSALVARKLYDVKRVLVASPEFFASRPTPETPNDLAGWEMITLTQAPQKAVFSKEGHDPIEAPMPSRVEVNDAHALYRLARAGAGLSVVPDYMAEADLRDGAIVKVLPDWSPDDLGVYAVWPSNAPRAGLTRRLIDFLAAWNW